MTLKKVPQYKDILDPCATPLLGGGCSYLLYGMKWLCIGDLYHEIEDTKGRQQFSTSHMPTFFHAAGRS
jgi:hypothetical protein